MSSIIGIGVGVGIGIGIGIGIEKIQNTLNLLHFRLLHLITQYLRSIMIKIRKMEF